MQALSACEGLAFDPEVEAMVSHLESLNDLKNHVWISSSGSSSKKKFFAISHEALHCSAQSVNAWLNVDAQDCWAIALPLNHIGGFSILARAHQAGFTTVQYRERWQPFRFCSFLAETNSSICSLVPTQIFDLVVTEQAPPPNLRAVVVGGGALPHAVYIKARELRWPLLPSYGLTECASQVACAPLSSLLVGYEQGQLHVMPHVECRRTSDRVLEIRSPALATAIVTSTGTGQYEIQAINNKEFFRTQDLVLLSSSPDAQILQFIGRVDRQVKIKGNLISLDEMENSVRQFLSDKKLQILSALTASDDPRESTALTLHVSAGSPAPAMLTELNSYLSRAKLPSVKKLNEHDSFPLLANRKIDYARLHEGITEVPNRDPNID